MPDATPREALEARLRASHDDGTIEVYADVLLEADEPLGHLLALETAPSSIAGEQLLERKRTLRAAVLGPTLAEAARRGDLVVFWRGASAAICADEQLIRLLLEELGGFLSELAIVGRSVDPAAVARALTHRQHRRPPLKRLILAAGFLGGGGLVDLLRSGVMSTVRGLDLRACDLGDRDLEGLAAAASNLSALETLSIARCGQRGDDRLAKVLSAVSVRALELVDCVLDSKHLGALAMPTVESVDLTRSRLLCEAAKTSRERWASLIRGINASRTLRELNLVGCPMRYDELNAALAEAAQVRRLGLPSLSRGQTALYAALGPLTELRELDLGDNSPTADLSGLERVDELRLKSSCSPQTVAAWSDRRVAKKLRHLDLYLDRTISTRWVAEALEAAEDLASLRLTGRGAQLLELAASLTAPLRALALRAPVREATGWAELRDARCVRSLQHLDLGESCLSGEELSAVLSAARELRSLAAPADRWAYDPGVALKSELATLSWVDGTMTPDHWRRNEQANTALWPRGPRPHTRHLSERWSAQIELPIVALSRQALAADIWIDRSTWGASATGQARDDERWPRVPELDSYYDYYDDDEYDDYDDSRDDHSADSRPVRPRDRRR